MVRRIAKTHVCGRLGQSSEFGRVDICKEPQGHEGAHRGRWHGMVWEDVPGHRQRSEVSSLGGSTIKESGGNIRGNQ